MIVASHTIAELYAVLSTLPIKPRITPLIAGKLINENIEPNSKCISLATGEYKSVIKQISELGLGLSARLFDQWDRRIFQDQFIVYQLKKRHGS